MGKMISAVHYARQKGADLYEVKRQLEQTAVDLQQWPGFLYYRLLSPIAPDDGYKLLTFWQSRQHYQAAVQAD
ncbi:MAG: antibiotic biosynthesis monooxygenase [Chloroflexi bacterium]|nr:antibiotic biosynthesis monooxygenase [Chloroflexota bacterium]